MDKIKVLIVDEQPYFRAGVAQALSHETDITVMESDIVDRAAFLTLLEDEMPDIVLLGSDLTNEKALELGRMIVRYFPTTRVVILSPDPNDEELFEVIRTSAVACIKKSTSPIDLISILRRAVRGEYPINDSLFSRPVVAQHVLHEFQHVTDEIPDNLVALLTKRETHVLTEVANGQSNKQIATAMQSSEQTIKNHVSAILRKLNANDRAHAAVLAIRRGLIPLAAVKDNSDPK